MTFGADRIVVQRNLRTRFGGFNMNTQETQVQIEASDHLLTGATLLPPESIDSESEVALPSNFEYIGSGRFAVQLFGEGCLDCQHLRSGGSKDEIPSCHHTNGNVNCPIPTTELQFTGMRTRYRSRMQKALRNGDRARFARLMSEATAELSEADFTWLTDQFVVNPD